MEFHIPTIETIIIFNTRETITGAKEAILHKTTTTMELNIFYRALYINVVYIKQSLMFIIILLQVNGY